MSKLKYYVTTAVYEAGAGPLVGSLYTAVLCDAIARHKRMCGFDVAHFVGADRHGVNLEPADDGTAAVRAASLQQDCRMYEELLSRLDIHCTHFQYTYSPEHILAVETLLRRTLGRSHLAIYKDRYQGRYCPHDQVNVSDSAEPADCAICGRPAVLVSEDRHFFRLSDFQGRLMALYKYHPEFIRPQSRLDEIRRLVARGLKDIGISRRSTGHGIPWPSDPGRVVYGPYIELATYLSGIGFGEGGYGTEEFKRYWPPNVQVIANEALLSHAVYWPAFLMAADMPVPHHIFVHPTLSLEETEAESGPFPEPMLQVLGSDAVRYYLLREVGYGDDAAVGSTALVKRYETDLAKGLASFADRVLGLVARHCDGRIPIRSLFGGVDSTIEMVSADIRAEVQFLLDHGNFSEGLKKIWLLMASIEELLTNNAGLESANDQSGRRRFKDVLHDACEGLGLIALLLHPVLPRATDAIWCSLGQTTRLEDQLVCETPWSCLVPGTPIQRLSALFSTTGDPKLRA
jgi:methionyl-tRNA synthetase